MLLLGFKIVECYFQLLCVKFILTLATIVTVTSSFTGWMVPETETAEERKEPVLLLIPVAVCKSSDFA